MVKLNRFYESKSCVYISCVSKNHTQKPISFQSSCSTNDFKLVQSNATFMQWIWEIIFFFRGLQHTYRFHQTFTFCIISGNLLFLAYFNFIMRMMIVWSWNQMPMFQSDSLKWYLLLHRILFFFCVSFLLEIQYMNGCASTEHLVGWWWWKKNDSNTVYIFFFYNLHTLF